jgi:uncharacterized protein YcfJ
MKNKLGLLSLTALIACAVQPALARELEYVDEDQQQLSYDYARVVSAKPIYEQVEVDAGREVCRNERVRYEQAPIYDDYARPRAAPVFGAIIGGLIGNQFGHGSGRAAATVAGVALGSAIAEDSQNQRYRRSERHQTRTERVCEYRPQVRTQRELVGYDVTYDYKGQVGHTTTQNQPGQTIRVEVAVTVVED